MLHPPPRRAPHHRHHTSSRQTLGRLVAVAALAASALALTTSPAVAAAKPAKAPAGLKFYVPPKTLSGKHGALIWSRPLHGKVALTGAARNYLLLYRSTSVGGKAIAVSGTLAIPKGKAPKGGWPVVSWAHGTTGVADICAPSRTPVSYPTLNTWLEAGYAVARTDYEGLGTPGVHPYLIGESEGRGVVDIVTASRQLVPSLSRNWVAAGHSQGGHAALWAAALGPKWAPALKLRGVDAIAPASGARKQVELASGITTPGGGLSAGGAGIFIGAAAASPSTIKLADLLTPTAYKLVPDTETECVGQLSARNSWGGLAPADVINPSYDRTALYTVLDANEPSTLHIKVPTLVQQGDDDAVAFKFLTDPLVASLKANGASVDYKTYPGVDHDGIVVGAPAADATAWLKTVLR
jgi:pimeloyl-ACP methyl ester carboxylesterase